MRRAARVDKNHADIVALLRWGGANVLSLAPMGRGVPDLLVNVGTRFALVEVKDGAKAPSKQRLTPDEEQFAQRWPVTIIRNDADALELLRVLKEA